jgi:hypothetical protein
MRRDLELDRLRALEAQRQDAVLDDLLSRWHQWQQRARVGLGWKPRAPGFGGYRCSRQYDDANGALDDNFDADTMRRLEFEVSELPTQPRAAIYCLARALTVGASVFTSPRLPADPAERTAVVKQARAALMRRLVAAGLM